MPSIEKFAIVAGCELEKSVEQTLAENMYTILDYYGNPDEVLIMDGMYMGHMKADPYFHGMDSNDRHHAFRLKATPAFTAETPADPIKETSGTTVVITMEHGYSDDEENEIMSEESFHWQPYVMLVVNAQDTNNPVFLNATDGKELDFEDTMHLTTIVSGMQEAYRDDLFATDIGFSPSDRPPLIRYIPVEQGKYGNFSPEPDSSCRSCAETDTYCFHQDGMQN